MNYPRPAFLISQLLLQRYTDKITLANEKYIKFHIFFIE